MPGHMALQPTFVFNSAVTAGGSKAAQLRRSGDDDALLAVTPAHLLLRV